MPLGTILIVACLEYKDRYSQGGIDVFHRCEVASPDWDFMNLPKFKCAEGCTDGDSTEADAIAELLIALNTLVRA